MGWSKKKTKKLCPQSNTKLENMIPGALFVSYICIIIYVYAIYNAPCIICLVSLIPWYLVVCEYTRTGTYLYNGSRV